MKYTIGEVAKITGATTKTVRYYDEIGLLKPSELSTAGYRLYTTEEIWQLELILTLRYLGFGIDEIRKLISGEVRVKTALAWQIEALDAQIGTLSSMKAILQRAMDNEEGEDSLDHIHDLVDSISNSTEVRKRFIDEKVKASVIPAQTPPEWKEHLVQSITTFLPKEGKLSARQVAAWEEFEELLEDPAYIEEIRQDFEPLLKNLHHLDVKTWIKREQELMKRMVDGVDEHTSAESPVVQEVIQGTAMMLAEMENTPYTPAYFREFAKRVFDSITGRTERLWKLYDIINPEYGRVFKLNTLFLQGLHWKLAEMDKEQSGNPEQGNE